MSKTIGVLIGRFSGYHYYHHEHVRKAALENDLLIIIVGSRNARRSIKNPWSAEERIAMIEANIKADPELASARIIFRVANDHPDNNVWADWIRTIVGQLENENTKVTLYGSDKDVTTFYLNMFPEWNKATVPAQVTFDATQLRQMWFEGQQTVDQLRKSEFVPFPTLEFLADQPYNIDLQGEWKFYQDERSRFASYPYPDTLTFNCGDAVVVCHNKVLMIRRKANPGKGCLALPGGFKNRDETFFDAAVRELAEETKFEMPYSHLMRCLVRTQLFDNPRRNIGIPRATLAAYFDVSRYYMDFELPITKAADDAAEVEWVDKNDLLFMTDVFDDHAAIVTTITKGI